MEEAASKKIVDCDPHRMATYLDENGVPRCYLGHAECYDMHTNERLADEADWEAEKCYSTPLRD